MSDETREWVFEHLNLALPPDLDVAVPLETIPRRVLAKCREAHPGLYRFHISLKRKRTGGSARAGADDTKEDIVFSARFPRVMGGGTPKTPPEKIAQLIYAVAAAYAGRRKKLCDFVVSFYGEKPARGGRRPRKRLTFRYNGTAGMPWETDDVEEEEGDDEGDAEEDDDETGDDEEIDDPRDEGRDEEVDAEIDADPEDGDDDDEGDDDDDDGDDDDDDDDWSRRRAGYPRKLPRSRHEPGVRPYQHISEDEYASSFPPGGAPPAMSPAELGAMVDHRGRGYHMSPGEGLFLHHLGGTFAETRATMQMLVGIAREAQANERAAYQQILQMSNSLLAERNHLQSAANTGWNALHQGMQMQLEALTNSAAWQRENLRLEYQYKTAQLEKDKEKQAEQGTPAWLNLAMMLAPLVCGGISQVVHYARGASGPPPPLIPPELAGLMMGGMNPEGGMPGMPGMAPDGGAPPPGFVPPDNDGGSSCPAPPPGFTAPSGFAPPPGFDNPSPDSAPAPANPSAGVPAPPSAPASGDLRSTFEGPAGPGGNAEPTAVGGAEGDGRAHASPGPTTGASSGTDVLPHKPAELSPAQIQAEAEAQWAARLRVAPIQTAADALLQFTAAETLARAQAHSDTGDLVQLLRQIVQVPDADPNAAAIHTKLWEQISNPRKYGTMTDFLTAEQAQVLADIRAGLATRLGLRVGIEAPPKSSS